MIMPDGLLRTSGVYQITNTFNGKFYIGSSVDLYRRYYNHHTSLTKNKHENPKLQRSWNKHGEDWFEFSIVEFLPKDIGIVREREQFYIDTFRPYYNIVPDVSKPLSMPRSASHSKNHSIAMQNSKWVQSDEYSQSQSEKVKALWNDPEYREKILKIRTSEESRKNHSEASKKVWENPSVRERISKTFKDSFASGRAYFQKGRSKVAIDADMVRNIRNLHGTGEYTWNELAEMFSVGSSTVGRIVKRQSWAWVD